MKVALLGPSLGENISVRRNRIADHLESMGATVSVYDSSGLDSLSTIISVLRGEYDAIIGTVRIGLYLGYPISKLLRIPMYGDVSDPLHQIEYLPAPLFKLAARYEQFVLRRTHGNIFVYQSSYENAIDAGIDGTKLPNAVDLERFSTPPSDIVEFSERELVESGVSLENNVAVYLGNLAPKYNIADIIEAANLVSDWEFVFIGTGSCEEIVSEASDSIANVHYVGQYGYDYIPGFLAHADLGFCLVDAEQPLKLKEYGAAGVATMAVPGELSNAYSESELLFVEPSPQAIAEKLSTLSDNPQQLSKYATRLHTEVSTYSWRDIAETYYEMIAEAIDAD